MFRKKYYGVPKKGTQAEAYKNEEYYFPDSYSLLEKFEEFSPEQKLLLLGVPVFLLGGIIT